MEFLGLHELENFVEEYGSPEDRPEARRWYIIVDYMMRSHMFAVELPNQSAETCPVIFINGHYETVTQTWTAYIEDYLRDPEAAAFPERVFGAAESTALIPTSDCSTEK
jgi:hypothetical protein